MTLKRIARLFESHPGFKEFKKSISGPEPVSLDAALLRDRALVLSEEFEYKGDRSDLREALADLAVSFHPTAFHQASAMLSFLGQTLFHDVSRPPDHRTLRRILDFDGPLVFFVGHTSYFDYMLIADLLREMGLPAPVMHVSGSLCRGRPAQWLTGLRTLAVPKHLNEVRHRAYSWYCAALAEAMEPQVMFARTSRYAVRSRDGILREPYVPHGVLASVRATGHVMVVPVAVSYSIIPEDKYLSSDAVFPLLSMFPHNRGSALALSLGLGNPERVLRKLGGVFSDVSVDLGEPIELVHDDSFTLQRISQRAIEAIARNKMIQPSQVVAKAIAATNQRTVSGLREEIEKELEGTKAFFQARYRKEPPFHPLLATDVPAAVLQGIRDLTGRGAIERCLFRRAYVSANDSLLQFYAYHADRRIYPLRGRNTMAVVNAGVWGYTLALHIGRNLLAKEELAEHSLVLYDSREDLIEKLTVEGKHPWHFRDIPLPRSVRPEADLRAAVGDTSLILLVTPSKYFYSTMLKVLELAPDMSDLVIATKGFIPETGLLPCDSVYNEMQRIGKRMRVSVLSGANLAHEVVEGGAGVTQLACEDIETFERLRMLIETRRFRVVYSNDVIGTSISAALKNVYAIGYGILEGSKRAPENFLATYSTLVTAEIRTFGLLLGARPESFDAESQGWMADLLATCRGGRSAQFGRDLAARDDKQGKSRPARYVLEQYRKKKIAVEGFEASRFARRMASQRGFHPPILGEIYSILHGGEPVDVESFIDKCLDVLTNKLSQAPAASAGRRSKIY
ncbi:MAG: hypothetical protein AB1646_00260 [Thermodesulfobacteriota bacterium]